MSNTRNTFSLNGERISRVALEKFLKSTTLTRVYFHVKRGDVSISVAIRHGATHESMARFVIHKNLELNAEHDPILRSAFVPTDTLNVSVLHTAIAMMEKIVEPTMWTKFAIGFEGVE